jgi:hypothetical protein
MSLFRELQRQMAQGPRYESQVQAAALRVEELEASVEQLQMENHRLAILSTAPRPEDTLVEQPSIHYGSDQGLATAALEQQQRALLELQEPSFGPVSPQMGAPVDSKALTAERDRLKQRTKDLEEDLIDLSLALESTVAAYEAASGLDASSVLGRELSTAVNEVRCIAEAFVFCMAIVGMRAGVFVCWDDDGAREEGNEATLC